MGTFNTVSMNLLSSRPKLAKFTKKTTATRGFYLLACFSLLDASGLESQKFEKARVNEETRTRLKSFFFVFG